jgi:hypothetical protein
MTQRHGSLAYRHWLEYRMLVISIAVLTVAPAVVIMFLAVGDAKPTPPPNSQTEAPRPVQTHAYSP